MADAIQPSSCSRCRIATAVIGAAALITVVVLAVLYHRQVPLYAKKWSAAFIKSPLYVQLPVVGAASLIITYLFLLGSGRLIDRCRHDQGPDWLREKKGRWADQSVK